MDTGPVRPETSNILSFVTLLSEVDIPFTYLNYRAEDLGSSGMLRNIDW